MKWAMVVAMLALAACQSVEYKAEGRGRIYVFESPADLERGGQQGDIAREAEVGLTEGLIQ